MLRLAIDENLHNDIVRGLLRKLPSLDIVRVQDAGLTGRDDPTILAWAATELRVLVTHDVATLVGYAYERVTRGEPMPGVIEIGTDLATGARSKTSFSSSSAPFLESSTDR